IWDGTPRVVTLRLGYRLPDSGEVLEQSVVVEAGPPEGASGDELRLSHESMAEHYAMANVYLGLRAATLQADRGGYDCALSTLDRLATSATRWVGETGDPDIEADLELIAMFQGNLREQGAQPVSDAQVD